MPNCYCLLFAGMFLYFLLFAFSFCLCLLFCIFSLIALTALIFSYAGVACALPRGVVSGLAGASGVALRGRLRGVPLWEGGRIFGVAKPPR